MFSFKNLNRYLLLIYLFYVKLILWDKWKFEKKQVSTTPKILLKKETQTKKQGQVIVQLKYRYQTLVGR